MSECRSCGAPIRWVETEKGKPMPVDAEPVPDGNIVLRFSDERRGTVAEVAVYLGPLEAQATAEPRFKSHFATCPQSSEWRKRPLPR